MRLSYEPERDQGSYVVHTLGSIEVINSQALDVYLDGSIQPKIKLHIRVLGESLACLLVVLDEYRLKALILIGDNCFERIGDMSMRLAFGGDSPQLEQVVLMDGISIELSLLEYMNIRLG